MEVFATLLTAPAIIAVVNLFKKYGLPATWAPIVSILIGAVFGVIVTFATGLPLFELPTTIMMGIVAGLTASGSYDVAVTVGNRPVEATIDTAIVVPAEQV